MHHICRTSSHDSLPSAKGRRCMMHLRCITLKSPLYRNLFCTKGEIVRGTTFVILIMSVNGDDPGISVEQCMHLSKYSSSEATFHTASCGYLTAIAGTFCTKTLPMLHFNEYPSLSGIPYVLLFLFTFSYKIYLTCGTLVCQDAFSS